MSSKSQLTGLNKNFGNLLRRLENWTVNPWRRYSLYLIVFLIGFFIGSSLGMVNGALALMDPLGAFFAVIALEIMVRVRRFSSSSNRNVIAINLIDMNRMGLLYGLFMEGFKLL
tara:strand:- start:2706 stop:3047 length:342 start_codon:yes stop_codon:yes gene_type:complete